MSSVFGQTPPIETDDVITLSEFSVTGVPDGSYMATESTSGTRIATEIINLPYSVQLQTWDTRVNLAANAAFLAAVDWVDKTRGVWNGNRSVSHQTINDKQAASQVELTKVWRASGVKQRSLVTFDVFSDKITHDVWALNGTPLDNELISLGLTTVQQRIAWKRPDPFNASVSGLLPLPACNLSLVSS